MKTVISPIILILILLTQLWIIFAPLSSNSIGNTLDTSSDYHADKFGIKSGNIAFARGNSEGFEKAIFRIGQNGGGYLRLPCGDIYVNKAVDIIYAGVTIKGCSSLQNFHDWGIASHGTRILPSAKIFDEAGRETAILRHRTLYSKHSSKNSGGGFEDIEVDGNGLAFRALDVDSVSNCYEKILAIDIVGPDAFFVHAGVTGTDLAEAADVQGCVFEFTARQIDGPVSKKANLVTIDGTFNANTSFNKFRIRGQFADGHALNAVNADNNIIDLAALRIANGKGHLAFMHGRKKGQSPGAFTNTFIRLSGNAPSYAEGPDDGSGGATNSVLALDSGNGTPAPTFGMGAHWQTYQNELGVTSGAIFDRAFVTDGASTRSNGKQVVLPPVTLTVENNSGAHVVLTDGVRSWVLRLLASGTLDMTQIAGAQSSSTPGQLNVGSYASGGRAGVTCDGFPSRLFSVSNGIVTRC